MKKQDTKKVKKVLSLLGVKDASKVQSFLDQNSRQGVKPKKAFQNITKQTVTVIAHIRELSPSELEEVKSVFG